MAHKHSTKRFSFDTASATKWMLAVSLALSLLLSVTAQQPRATTNMQSGGQTQPATAQDERRTAARRKFAEGEALRVRRTKESLRMAVKKYEEALLLLQVIGDREGEAKTLSRIGHVYRSLGDEQKKLEFFTKAMLLLIPIELAKRKLEEGKTLRAQRTAESLRMAVKKYEEALPLWKAVGDRGEEADTLISIGMIYENDLGEKQKAVGFYSQSLLLWRAIGDRNGEAIMLTAIGKVYDDLGEKQKALDFYNQALPLYRVADRSERATTLRSIGEIYYSLSENQKALDFHNQALPLYRAIADRNGEAKTLNNIGAIYYSLGEKQKAINFYNRALPLWRTVADRHGEAATLSNIGKAYDNLGEKQKSLDFLNRALLLWRTVGDRSGEADMLHSIGTIYGALGEKQKALDFFIRALPLLHAVSDRRGEAATLGNIGLNYYLLGEKQKALDFFNQALSLYRAISDRSGEADMLSSIGTIYGALGEKQKALDFYNQALLLYRADADRSGEATTLRSIGEVYYSLHENQKALDFYNQSLPLLRAIADRRGEASVLTGIGNVYDAVGEMQRSLDFYNRALPLLRAVGDRSGEAHTLSNIGKVYDVLGERQKALDFLNRALLLWRTVADSSGDANTLTGIGEIYDILGEHQKALDFYNRALPLLRAVGDRSGEARILNNIGKVYYSLREHHQKALGFYNQALQLWRAIGDRRGEALTLAGIGNVYDDLGEKQQALDFYNQALQLWRAIGDRGGEAPTLLGIGNVYSSLGEKQRALDLYNQALPLWRTVADRGGEANTLNNIGSIYDDLGEKQKALDFYNRALQLWLAAGDRRGEAATLTSIGATYDALGEKQKAFNCYNRALVFWHAIAARREEAATLINLGTLISSLGEQQKALDFYNQALLLCRTVAYRNGEAMALVSIASVERDLSHFNESRSHIESALSIFESLRTKIVSKELRSSYFVTAQDYYEFYIDLLMQMHKQESAKSHDVAALRASERARARSLLESLTEARANIRRGVAPNLLARERELQQRLNEKAEYQLKLNSGLYSEEQVAAVAKEVAKEIDALAAELQQLQTQIRQTSPHYAALTQPQPLTAVEIQQQVLDADTLLLEYSLGSEHSFLWAVTPTAVNSYELPKREVIETAAQRVRDLLITPNRSVRGETEKQRGLRQVQAREQFPAAAAELSRMLLAPVAQQLGKKRLVIVADGALHYLPFGVLPDPNNLNGKTGNWQPLVVEHEIVNLPSASTLAVLRRELAGRKPAAKMLAVLADPVFDKCDGRIKTRSCQTEEKSCQPTSNSDIGRILKQIAQNPAGKLDDLHIARLPCTRQEADQILALVPAGAGMKALDFEASRATATSDQLSQYRYVHFATHGWADRERPELSTIVLSLFDEQGRPQDGFLRAHEVYNLNLPAELVVLSACETGLGKLTKGEGLVSLTRGFMYAGAARVVVSLWNVNDRATAELMTKFYRRVLVEGERPAAALRAAQIEMWRDKRWEAPYYWAAFTLQGEWR